MNTKEENGLLNFIREIEPLEFDPALVNEYLECFTGETHKLSIMDELEHLYDEIDDFKDRLDRLSIIGNSNVYFDCDEDEFANEE